ncbi:MAG: hypothetical protein D6740_03995 [Alphaproteobacteria bacterium]|nr:MAG: hypothetical protein D6740_03995 [Alphaproteobacteria bacterium]
MAGCRLLFVVELGPDSERGEAQWEIRLGRPAEEGEERILALNDEPAAVLAWLHRLCAAGQQQARLVVIARPDPLLGTLHALEAEEGAREALAKGGQNLGRVKGTVAEVAQALARWLGEKREPGPIVKTPPDKRIAIA